MGQFCYPTNYPTCRGALKWLHPMNKAIIEMVTFIRDKIQFSLIWPSCNVKKNKYGVKDNLNPNHLSIIII